VEHHYKQPRLTRPRKLRTLGLAEAERRFEVLLESATLGLHGIVDLVLLMEDEVVPVEFKLQDAPPTHAICMQLLAYGLLGEEGFERQFSRGLVICGSRSRTYPVKRTARLEEQLGETLARLREDRFSPVLPPSSAQANKCTQCEYLPHCNDRF
jgi:CRISPR-associated exonuclease Cas4